MTDEFAVFICTHGRPDNQTTLTTLRKCGYTGKVYLVLDDTDNTIQQYIDNYDSDYILVFNKNHYINTCDTGSNMPYYKTILYAKNAVEDMAKSLGFRYFVIADDDILNFRVRYPEEGKLKSYKLTYMDSILDVYFKFMQDGNLAMLGFGTMLFCGVGAFNSDYFMNLRVPYNFILRCIDKPIDWKFAYGEDIITTKYYQHLGYRTLVVPFVQIDIIPPGSVEPGGMDQTYKDLKYGIQKCLLYFLTSSPGTTQLKSNTKANKSKLIAAIKQNKTFPKILSGTYRKEF